MCGELEVHVGAFLRGPIEGVWPCLWIDAPYVRTGEDERIAENVREVFDLRPKGREEPEFTWEKTDKIAVLRDLAGLKD